MSRRPSPSTTRLALAVSAIQLLAGCSLGPGEATSDVATTTDEATDVGAGVAGGNAGEQAPSQASPSDAEDDAADAAPETPHDFVALPGDEVLDPLDPPVDPDPSTDDPKANAIACPSKHRPLSPQGMTFALHVSKHYPDEAVAQLVGIRHLLRARDVFVIEAKNPALAKLRKEFPCNRFHFIAYPNEWKNAVAAAPWVDGIAIDWEGYKVWNGSEAWTTDRLSSYAENIAKLGRSSGVVPYWPGSFDDGRILKSSGIDYEIAQIQNQCAHAGPGAFASAARSLLDEVKAHGRTTRDIGFEISLNSFADKAGNHTGVKRSAECARRAYGKGARAIYLYGNAQPHFTGFFKAMSAYGVRKPQ